MIKISSRIHKEGHDLCGKVIYSNKDEDYKYDIDSYEGKTRYYFNNILLKTESDKIVVLIFKELHWQSFHAVYTCLWENKIIKVYHVDVKEILNIK